MTSAARPLSETFRRARLRFRRWRRLPRAEQWLVVVAVGLNAVVERTVHRVGLARTSALLSRWSTPLWWTPQPVSSIAGARRIGALTNRAAVEPAPLAACLARSLSAQLLLSRRGCPTTLQIGVRRVSQDDAVGSDFHFHAWLEVGGVPVNDRDDIAQIYAGFPPDSLPSVVAGTAPRSRRRWWARTSKNPSTSRRA